MFEDCNGLPFRIAVYVGYSIYVNISFLENFSDEKKPPDEIFIYFYYMFLFTMI